VILCTALFDNIDNVHSPDNVFAWSVRVRSMCLECWPGPGISPGLFPRYSPSLQYPYL